MTPLAEIQITDDLVDDLGGLNPYHASFRLIAKEYAEHLRLIAGLVDTDRILDVGCGVGRIVADLLPTHVGRYLGLDVHKGSISWCDANVTEDFENFEFRRLSKRHPSYNPDGDDEPLGDFGTFDLVIAVGLLQCLLPEQLNEYFELFKRSLRPQGKLFLTGLFLDKTSREHVKSLGVESTGTCIELGEGQLTLLHDLEGVLELCKRHKLYVSNGVRLGSWCGRKRALTSHDLLLAINDV